MGKIKFVRKRDGRIVPFDKSKIADAIFKAAQSVGGHDRYLAEDLAEAVTLYLENYYNGDIPSVEEIQDIVERVLIKTGHAKTAKAYILYREKRSRIRKIKEGKTEGFLKEKEETKKERELIAHSVDVISTDKISKWDRKKVVETIIKETGLPENIADFIVMEVEELIVSSKLKNLSTQMIRELVNVKLIEYGFERERNKHSQVGISVFDLKNLIKNYGKDPDALSMEIGKRIKKDFALMEVFSQEVSNSHLKGEININNISQIDKFFSISLNPGILKEKTGSDLSSLLDLLTKYFTKRITLIGLDIKSIEEFYPLKNPILNLHLNEDIGKIIEIFEKIPLNNIVFGKYKDDIIFAVDKIDINFPKIAHISKGDIFKNLDDIIRKVVDGFVQKRDFIREISIFEKINIPLKFEEGIYIVGISGIRIGIEIITGREFYSEESLNTFREIINYIEEKLKRYSEEKNLRLFIGEGEEDSERRFSRINKEEFGKEMEYKRVSQLSKDELLSLIDYLSILNSPEIFLRVDDKDRIGMLIEKIKNTNIKIKFDG